MTFNEIFDIAMDLADERATSGAINVGSTALYRAKAPGLFTILQAEVGLSSGSPAAVVSALTEECLLPDYAAVAVLPYGLVAHLMADENPPVASFYQQRYEEAKRKIPAKAVKGRDVYNLGLGAY